MRVSYSTLYRFARAQCDFTPATVTVRVAEPPAGEAAEVDFGLLGLWTDPATGARRRIYGLLVTLCFSRYAFLGISLRQDLPAVLDGLEAAWAFFGGVVKRLVDRFSPSTRLRDVRAAPPGQRRAGRVARWSHPASWPGSPRRHDYGGQWGGRVSSGPARRSGFTQ